MKKISTETLVTCELECYLDGVLSNFSFDDTNLEQFVTGRALELLKKLPSSERSYAISKAIAAPNYDCVNGFPCNQGEDEFFLPCTEFEIDITNMKLQSPEDFFIREIGDCKLAYYSLDYGAFIALDMDKLAEYVSDYLADQAAEESE